MSSLPEGPPARSRFSWVTSLVTSPVVRWGFVVIAGSLAIWALLSERAAIVAGLQALHVGVVLLAVAAIGVSIVCASAIWWIVLADLGSRLPILVGARIFFVGQLGKYLPGSLWPLVTQAELGREQGVPVQRSVTASIMSSMLAVLSAALLIVTLLPMGPQITGYSFDWLILLAIPLCVLVWPRIFLALLNTVMTRFGREPLEKATTIKGTVRALVMAGCSWAATGIAIWVLAIDLGAQASMGNLALCVGGYALAWAFGALVPITPAGAGVRDGALAAVLVSILPTGEALVVALVIRVIFTLLDVVFAALGLGLFRWVHGDGRTGKAGRQVSLPKDEPSPEGSRAQPEA